jgi:hypothetical protein
LSDVDLESLGSRFGHETSSPGDDSDIAIFHTLVQIDVIRRPRSGGDSHSPKMRTARGQPPRTDRA